MNTWNHVLSGGILVGYWAIGAFFFRFHARSRDRFFFYFGCAFWLLAFERLLLVRENPMEEARWYIYLVRLVAFLFILYAILDKNRGTAKPQ